MLLHEAAIPILTRGVDHHIYIKYIPRHLSRPVDLHQPGTEPIVSQEITLQTMALRLIHFGAQQIVQNFALADIGDRNYFNVLAAGSQFKYLSPGSAETHNAHSNGVVLCHLFSPDFD